MRTRFVTLAFALFAVIAAAPARAQSHDVAELRPAATPFKASFATELDRTTDVDGSIFRRAAVPGQVDGVFGGAARRRTADWTSRFRSTRSLADGRPSANASDWKLAALDVSVRALALADVKSTYDTRTRCLGGCVESNPYAAWFINQGPRVAYPATMAFDTGVSYLAYLMRKSSHPVIRRIWFVPQLALIAGHAVAIRQNYGIQHGATVAPLSRR